MRILLLAPYVPSRIRVRPYQFIRELSKRHEITVLATGPARESSHVAQLKEECHRVHFVPMHLATGILSCALGALRGDPLQASICHSPALVNALRSLLSAESFDLVHVEHLRAARLVDVLPARIPRVFDAVDSISLLHARTLVSSHSVRQRAVAAMELGRTRSFERRILAAFDRTAITSPEDRDQLLRLAPDAHVTVVPNGVDMGYFAPMRPPREPATLVFSGKMSYHANVTAALYFARNILPLIRARRPEVQLRIAGADPPDAIRALARDPGITVTGYVPDLRPSIGTASLAVCPVTVKVGIQNKLLEAMAMGVPVVSTHEGVAGLRAQAGRDLAVAGGPTEFAAVVLELLNDPARAGEMGRAGRRYVEAQHRWDVMAGALEHLYVQAIEDRSATVKAQGGSFQQREKTLNRFATVR